MEDSPWNLSNKVLYDLCSAHPAHVETGAILAKILLIGRVYAAAIERRTTKQDEDENDSFYVEEVAPALRDSEIDIWLTEARSVMPGTPVALATLVKVHGMTTALFSEISGMEKRSMASKYLHFHVPELFYIYDSRAVEALRKFTPHLPRASRTSGLGDNEYRKFAEKCDHLQTLCEKEYSLRLLPRQVDNLLLGVNKK